jgi:CheY-like chemotaxis protein
MVGWVLADVVYLVQDMMFTSKIREAAKPFGLTWQGVREPSGLLASAVGAKLIIVDLRLPTALEALRMLAAEPGVAAIPSVGFVEHERTEVMEAARASGCSDVMAKGQFANALPRLMASLVAPPSAA